MLRRHRNRNCYAVVNKLVYPCRSNPFSYVNGNGIDRFLYLINPARVVCIMFGFRLLKPGILVLHYRDRCWVAYCHLLAPLACACLISAGRQSPADGLAAVSALESHVDLLLLPDCCCTVPFGCTDVAEVLRGVTALPGSTGHDKLADVAAIGDRSAGLAVKLGSLFAGHNLAVLFRFEEKHSGRVGQPENSARMVLAVTGRNAVACRTAAGEIVTGTSPHVAIVPHCSPAHLLAPVCLRFVTPTIAVSTT